MLLTYLLNIRLPPIQCFIHWLCARYKFFFYDYDFYYDYLQGETNKKICDRMATM